MKKLVFLFVAFAAISFASCTGNQAPATEGTDSVDSAAVVDSTDSVADSVAVDSVAADTVKA